MWKVIFSSGLVISFPLAFSRCSDCGNKMKAWREVKPIASVKGEKTKSLFLARTILNSLVEMETGVSS